MGVITNLIKNAGDFFNSTEEEQFMKSRKGIVYKKNRTLDWDPYQEEAQLQKVPYTFVDDDTDDEDEAMNGWEQFFMAKQNNRRAKMPTSVADISDTIVESPYRQANVSYMIDDDGTVVKM